MKSIRSLLMILIGMISFTTLATTPVLEQKQKPVIVAEFNQTVNAVVVDVYKVNYEAVSYSNSTMATDAKPLILNVPVINTFAIITDVGWRSYSKRNTDLHFKENVLSRADIYYLNKHSLKTNQKKKENPFLSSIPIRNYS